jgi:hypothetical protein
LFIWASRRAAVAIGIDVMRSLFKGIFALLLPPGIASAAVVPTFAPGVSQGIVNAGPLVEASGLTSSRNNDRVLWSLNDNGNAASIYAFDTQARHLATYELSGASNIDWEDIAIGPGPAAGVDYLYIGDIGGNIVPRSSVTIYRLPEPPVYLRQYISPVTRRPTNFTPITLTYPDGLHDAESLLVDPLTGDLFVATKEFSITRFYKATAAQLQAGAGALTLARTIFFDQASGAAVSPTGREIIIRQENFARLYQRSPTQSIDQALGGPLIPIPVIGESVEPNGESVSFDAIGQHYFTISEGANQPLYRFSRTTLDAPPTPASLIPQGSLWRYLDDGTNQAATWRNPGFTDTAWRSGSAELGYGDGDEQTTVSFGTNPSNKFITTYFRKTFSILDASSYQALTLKLLFDDGAAIYLNGQEIQRANLAPAAAFNTTATPQPDTLEDTWFTYPLDPALLLNGVNTLAVELHQSATNDPDLTFDLILTATPRPPQWNIDGGGAWGVSANWIGGVPAAGKLAAFRNALTAPHAPAVISLDLPRSAGSLIFDSPNPYHITAGAAGTLTLANNGIPAFISILAGHHQIDAAVTSQEDLTIDAADATSLELLRGLTLTTGKHLLKQGPGLLSTRFLRVSFVTIAEGQITLTSTSADVSRLENLQIAPGARLDLTNQRLIVQSNAASAPAALTALTALINRGRNTGPQRWLGDGLTSSTAASDPTSLTGLAIQRNANEAGQPINPLFGGLAVDSNSILIRYTWNGDTDLNGAIDANDYFHIDRGIAAGATGYHNGDFDYSGTIDANDYFLIDTAFAGQTGILGEAAAAVPEPLTAPFLLTILALAGKRQHKKPTPSL